MEPLSGQELEILKQAWGRQKTKANQKIKRKSKRKQQKNSRKANRKIK